MIMHETYMANIHPSKLKVDPRYQRAVETAKVNKICREFNMDLFNPPKVSKRADGFYYVFDGQHSMVAHKKQFGDDTPINCKVYEGLTFDEEVELFVQQTGVSSKVCTNDKLKAEYSKSESDVKDMVDAAKIAGVTIDFKNYSGDNHISAAAAAYSAWKLLGKDGFINVLSVIKESWFGAGDSFSAGFIKGLAYIYKHYGNNVKNKDVVNALKKNTPVWYVSHANDKHGSLALKYAQVFVEAYNRGKRNRLEEPKKK